MLRAFETASGDGRLGRPDEAGPWTVEVEPWPSTGARRAPWSWVMPSVDDAEERMSWLVELIEVGDWDPKTGPPLER